jgi:uncharacterized membrane protein
LEKILNEYLEKMEKYLKPVAVSERVDIIKEIKSEMQELQNNDIPAEQIIERLGDPKDLAKAYLGDLLSKESKFSWNRFLIVCAFYSLVGFSGMVVIPCLAIIAPTFIFCGIISPILVAVKMVDYIFGLGIPYVENIGVFLGGIVTFNPIIEFVISLVIGALLYWLGRGAWRLLTLYCKKISKTASNLSI